MHILSCLLEKRCVLNEHDVSFIVITNTLLIIQTIEIIAHSCSCSPIGALNFRIHLDDYGVDFEESSLDFYVTATHAVMTHNTI